MDNLIFLSAQDLATYYLWQTQLCISNLISLGINKSQVHVLFAVQGNQQVSAEDNRILESIRKIAHVFIYLDTREEKCYLSSIRPHIIGKHFLQFPELCDESFFYHDCDIYFRELPPLFNQFDNEHWYVSDTSNYLNSSYIKYHIGEDNFFSMCKLVNISPTVVVDQDANCGGAQYLMNKLTVDYWKKVEKDCEAIYRFLENRNLQNNIENALGGMPFKYSKGIQSWCADMWAVLWNALYFNHKVNIHSDLNFSWPRNQIENWNCSYILHNAGITEGEAGQFFYKGNYFFHTPFFEITANVDRFSCSFIYAEAIKQLAKSYVGSQLPDLTFLFPVKIDTEGRLNNLITVVRYLKKHFAANIIVLEYGKHSVMDSSVFPEGTVLFFSEGNGDLNHLSNLSNKLFELAKTRYISIYDADLIIPADQILTAMNLLQTNQCDVVYPYDECYTYMDQLSSAIFGNFLDHYFLQENREKFIVLPSKPVNGCIIINTESFRQTRKENIKLEICGRNEATTCQQLKILGYKIEKVIGAVYHMYIQQEVDSIEK